MVTPIDYSLDYFFAQVGYGLSIGALSVTITFLCGFVINKFLRLMTKG